MQSNIRQQKKEQNKVLLIIGLLMVFIIILHGKLQSQIELQNKASGQVIATILPAYSAVKSSQLNFGKFIPGSDGGSLIIAPKGKLSVKGNIVTKKELYNSASYYVIGDSTTVFSVSLPQKPAELINTTTANTLYVNNWESAVISKQEAGKEDNGIQTVFVGATLEVGSYTDNYRGIYTGTYSISFNFN